jgi:hypothetical protein
VPPALFSLYALTRSEFPRIGISGSLVSENTFLLGFSVNKGTAPPSFSSLRADLLSTLDIFVLCGHCQRAANPPGKAGERRKVGCSTL